MNNKSWFLYIAKTKTNRFYTGISRNVIERIENHNKGYGAKYAIDQGPFELVFVSKPINNYREARQLEIKIKKWSQVKKNKLISGEWKLRI
jgi:putative endonuclease